METLLTILEVKLFPSASVSFDITDDAVVVVKETVPPSFTCIISVTATGGSFTWVIVIFTIVSRPLANPSFGAYVNWSDKFSDPLWV